MKVAFRTDASVDVGTGHLIRCLTLADSLAARGVETTFLCAPPIEPWRPLIQNRGHRCIILAVDPGLPKLPGHDVTHPVLAHSRWLPWGQEADAGATRAALSAAVDWIVVDHYALDCRWERAVRDRTAHLMAIDDLADRCHECDLLLDHNVQSASGARYADLLPAGATSLLGPRYALLRPEFAQMRRRSAAGPVRRVNIFMGGTDAAGATVLALDALDGNALAELPIDVVIGGASPHLATIRQRARQRGNATVHVDTSRFAALLSAADLAIGAGGIAALERCCVGMPSVTVAVARNQEPALTELARQGAVLHAGRLDRIDVSVLRFLVKRLADDEVERAAIGRMAASVTDGAGGERVLAVLMDW